MLSDGGCWWVQRLRFSLSCEVLTLSMSNADITLDSDRVASLESGMARTATTTSVTSLLRGNRGNQMCTTVYKFKLMSLNR